MDYRRFLGKQEELVLPSLGGLTVATQGRALRLDEPLELGWWRFRVSGRKAEPVERADEDSEALASRPSVRGHLLSGARLVTLEGLVEPVHVPPEDEPPLFAPCTAKRWYSGELLFSTLEFEEDAEEAVRQALEDGRSLGEVKAVPASLRAAYAYALCEQESAALRVPIAPLEVRHAIGALADGGPEAARALLTRVQEQREAPQRRAQAAAAARRVTEIATRWTARTERLHAALDSAGARLLRVRGLSGGQVEVVYRFMGSRFLSVVDERSLRVIDAGVCLDGEDRLVTLESLPGVIREAIDSGELVVTRRVSDDD